MIGSPCSGHRCAAILLREKRWLSPQQAGIEMLVTFHCSVYADITMFGEVAKRMIKMMGHSGSVPGALRAGDVPVALSRLEEAIADLKEREQATASGDAGDDEEPPVSLVTRAVPLIELLQAASAEEVPVMWDRQ